jgi:GxxExxY protein
VAAETPIHKLYKETRKTGGKKVGVGTIVDLKAIKNLDDIHFAVVRSQLKVVGRQHGLLLNFAKTTLEPKRVIAS